MTLFVFPIYSIILTIANERLQVYMLYIVHYIQGIIQTFFIINATMWILTQWFWIESVEMDEERSEFGRTARDLQMWEIITVLPQMLFLSIFYIMLVDIDNFYTENPSTEANTFIFIFSTYSKSLATTITNVTDTLNKWLVSYYVFTYELLAIYLNPIVWVQWIIDQITSFYDYITNTFWYFSNCW